MKVFHWKIETLMSLLENAFASSCGISICVLCTVIGLNRVGKVSSLITRKILHIVIGPLFILCYLMFPDESPYHSAILAAVIPGAMTIGFLLVGMRIIQLPLLVQTVSRSGDASELLGGPFVYGIVHVLLCSLDLKNNPLGLLICCVLCIGDGFASIGGYVLKDLLGRIPWNPSKTVAGSFCFILFTIVIYSSLLHVYHLNGHLLSYTIELVPLFVIVSVCALVESLTISKMDNLSVTITAFLVGIVFLQVTPQL